ncbi:MAG: DUF4330 domain-containing protein [Candidatus Ornithomonoglobus sp.]
MADRKKWTLIDTLIVILVVVACVGGYKMFSTKATGGESNKIKVQVMITNQEQSFADAMTVGDDVTVSLTEKDSGTLIDFRTEPAEAMVYDAINGEYKNSAIEGRIDIYATVEMDVTETDYAFTAGSTIVQVGTKLPFRGKGYATEGYVITIDEEE